MSLTENPTSPDNTECAPHLVLALWIPYSKINLQLERHFLLSAAEEVSPVSLFSCWWYWLMRVWSEGWCRQLSSSKAFVKILFRGRYEQHSCPQEHYYNGNITHFLTALFTCRLHVQLLDMTSPVQPDICQWKETRIQSVIMFTVRSYSTKVKSYGGPYINLKLQVTKSFINIKTDKDLMVIKCPQLMSFCVLQDLLH